MYVQASGGGGKGVGWANVKRGEERRKVELGGRKGKEGEEGRKTRLWS